MKKSDFYLIIGLLLMVVSSSIGVVYSQYQTRSIFAEIEQIRAQQDEMESEWGRLQLEISSRTNYSKIEETAVNLLGLHRPHPQEIRIIE